MQEGPGEAAVAALREASETPERLWTAAMRATVADEVAHLAAQAHAAQVLLHSFLSAFVLQSSTMQAKVALAFTAIAAEMLCLLDFLGPCCSDAACLCWQSDVKQPGTCYELLLTAVC